MAQWPDGWCAGYQSCVCVFEGLKTKVRKKLLLNIKEHGFTFDLSNCSQAFWLLYKSLDVCLSANLPLICLLKLSLWFCSIFTLFLAVSCFNDSFISLCLFNSMSRPRPPRSKESIEHLCSRAVKLQCVTFLDIKITDLEEIPTHPMDSHWKFQWLGRRWLRVSKTKMFDENYEAWKLKFPDM